MQIAVVEDNAADFEQLRAALAELFRQRQTPCHITRYADAETFLAEYRRQYDLLFLDIELPGMNGMDAARKLRESDPDVALVFLTNLARFAINGYEVDAADYLLKPVDAYSLALKLPKVLRRIEQSRNRSIPIVTRTGVQCLNAADLFYVEVAAHQLTFHTRQGVYTSRGSMKEIEQMLERQHFHRCNNCYLVNLMHVSGIRDNTVQVGGETLTISRPKKKEFIQALTDFLGGTF